jgi:hypothetical protein
MSVLNDPVTLYVCEIWSLILWEEHRLRKLENRLLRRIFGNKMEGVSGGWRKLQNFKLAVAKLHV